MFVLLFAFVSPLLFFSSLISFKAEIIWLGITRRASIIHLAFADTRNAFVISMHVVSAARRRLFPFPWPRVSRSFFCFQRAMRVSEFAALQQRRKRWYVSPPCGEHDVPAVLCKSLPRVVGHCKRFVAGAAFKQQHAVIFMIDRRFRVMIVTCQKKRF